MSTSRPIFTARPNTIPDSIIQVLRLVDQVAVKQGIKYVLVGATARDIVLQGVFGLAPGRRTVDLDFGFAVKNWQEFAELNSAFLTTGSFEASEKESQRLFYRGAKDVRMIVDLMPFGGVADENATIAWPPFQDTVMIVAGFEEALSSAILVQVADDLLVPVVSLGGLTVLKLIAWIDRGSRDNRDATDLLKLLRDYADAGNEDRLYGEEIQFLQEANFDFELAGAQLLGKDVAAILTLDTTTRITDLLRSDQEVERLLVQMWGATTVWDEQDQARCADLLQAFRRGFFDQYTGPAGPQNESRASS